MEVLITGNTKVYFDTTTDRLGTIVDGRIQPTVVPFQARNTNLGDTVLAWGARRGDRLTAEVILIQRNS